MTEAFSRDPPVYAKPTSAPESEPESEPAIDTEPAEMLRARLTRMQGGVFAEELGPEPEPEPADFVSPASTQMASGKPITSLMSINDTVSLFTARGHPAPCSGHTTPRTPPGCLR